MSDFAAELKAQLETQRLDLSQQIRNLENNLLSLKESYLKVSGALEVLEIIQSKTDIEAQESLTVAGVAD